MLRKLLCGLTVTTLLLAAQAAIAANYKIDKQGQHAFIPFRIKHPSYRAGFEAKGKLALKDFNIKTNPGPASQEVELMISVESVRQN